MLIKKIILKSVVQTIGKKNNLPRTGFGIYNCGGVSEKP